jgi:hypothetical protein
MCWLLGRRGSEVGLDLFVAREFNSPFTCSVLVMKRGSICCFRLWLPGQTCALACSGLVSVCFLIRRGEAEFILGQTANGLDMNLQAKK